MRIAIVNDLPLAIEAVRRVLVADGRHAIAWIARDGAEAVEKCAADTPDLVLMDLIMPVMNGVEATRRIMAASPCAILVVTATVSGNASLVYEALGAGALDAVETPVLGQNSGFLLVKLEMLQKRILAGAAPLPELPPAVDDAAVVPAASADWLVAVGASAGGPAALARVLAGLPRDFPAAIVVVQHIDAAFVPGLITWLAVQCPLAVVPVVQGARLMPGRVYVAGGDRHVVIDPSGRLAQTDKPADCIYLPSIDVFMQSMAVHWRKAGTGLLLTGMGRDGARGLLELRRAGFSTIAQDRGTSAVYGMPKAAAELGAAAHVLPLESIPAHLCQQASKPPKPARI